MTQTARGFQGDEPVPGEIDPWGRGRLSTKQSERPIGAPNNGFTDHAAAGNQNDACEVGAGGVPDDKRARRVEQRRWCVCSVFLKDVSMSRNRKVSLQLVRATV